MMPSAEGKSLKSTSLGEAQLYAHVVISRTATCMVVKGERRQQGRESFCDSLGDRWSKTAAGS